MVYNGCRKRKGVNTMVMIFTVYNKEGSVEIFACGEKEGEARMMMLDLAGARYTVEKFE